MQRSYKGLWIAVGMMLAGTALFIGVLALMGIDPDKQPIGLLGWVLGGVLIGPGFGYLIKWKQSQNQSRKDTR